VQHQILGPANHALALMPQQNNVQHQLMQQQLMQQQLMQQQMAHVVLPAQMGLQVMPLTWISWTHFAWCQIQGTIWSPDDATTLIASTMRHAGSVFGLPTPPDTHSNQFLRFPHQDPQYKRMIAASLLGVYMERAKIEAWEKLKSQIEEEGENALKSILQGNESFEEIL